MAMAKAYSNAALHQVRDFLEGWMDRLVQQDAKSLLPQFLDEAENLRATLEARVKPSG
jgi:hypothetical protein